MASPPLSPVSLFTMGLDFASPATPVLDAYADANVLDLALLSADERHFAFCLMPDPCMRPPSLTGASFLRLALVPFGRSTLPAVYLVKDGRSRRLAYADLDSIEEEGRDDWQAHYIEAIDLVGLSKRLGIQQWGFVKLDCPDADKILAELPGPMMESFWTPFKLNTHTDRHVRRWYRSPDGNGLWVMAR